MRLTKNRVYDILHRGVVTGLVGFTAFGTILLGFKGVLWYMYRLPQLKENQRLKLEEKVSREQQEKEQELLRKQQEAETLKG